MFGILWRNTSQSELRSLWRDADAAGRQAIIGAMRSIEATLEVDPENVGESRAGGTRIHFEHPLGITFQVYPHQRLVRIAHVWDIRRRQ